MPANHFILSSIRGVHYKSENSTLLKRRGDRRPTLIRHDPNPPESFSKIH